VRPQQMFALIPIAVVGTSRNLSATQASARLACMKHSDMRDLKLNKIIPDIPRSSG